MHRRIMTVGLATALALSLATLAIAWRAPGNNQGYAPIQPISFSHKLHSGEMQIPCVYCHGGVETSRYAGIPALSTCMNCHRTVTTSFAAQKQPNPAESPELRKIYDALALDKALKPISGKGAETNYVEKSPPVAGLRLLRPPRTHHSGGNLPDVSRSHRNHGPGAAIRNTIDGMVRELPPRRQFEGDCGQSGARLRRLRHLSLLSRCLRTQNAIG